MAAKQNGTHPTAITPQTFTTSTGMVIHLTPVDPIFLQSVVSSVKMPKPPVYDIKTLTGRVETHRMDELAAKQLENGQSIWDAYVSERDEAILEQGNRTMRAMFYKGTEFELPTDGWEEKYQFIGMDVPKTPVEKKVFFLTTELSAEDTVALMGAIMRLGGVKEEAIREAEESFRDTVQAGR